MTTNVFGIIPEEGTEAHEAEVKSKETPPSSPQTTPDEQATTTEEPAAPSPAPEPTPPEPDPAPEPAKPEGEGAEEEDGLSEDGTGFRIGNKVYKDIMAADHAFRQNRGRAQAEAKRAKEAEDARRELFEENPRLKAQLDSQSGQTLQPDPAAPAPAPAAAQEGQQLTEPLTKDEINELIAEEGADAALLEVQRRADARAEERLDARTVPLRQQEEVAEAQQIASENFFNVSQLKGADGTSLYPELAEDAPTAPEIVATWDRLVSEDPDFRAIALSPAGVKYAYNEWKHSRPADTSQPAPSPEPAPAGTDAQNEALASMSQGSAPTPPPADPNAPPRPAQLPANTEEAVRKLIAAKQHPVFGVTLEK
jgi:hypothetical protein